MNRPSKKELYNKIRDARAAAAAGRIEIVEAIAIAGDALDLDYDLETELVAVLGQLLEMITPEHYKGSRPPQKSYEAKIEGLELFAFVVDAPRFDCRVYLKFALAQETLWLVSLHKNRPQEEDA